MGFLSQIANIFTGDESARAASKAGRIQQQEAVQQGANVNVAGQEAFDIVGQAGQEAVSRFDPLSNVGGRGVDLAGFLGSPEEQFQFLESNPLFQLGLDNLNTQTQQSAAARGRLSAGDTLQQLQSNALLAGQPLIDRQRQDIMGLLGIEQGAAEQQAGFGLNVAGQQAGIKRNTAQDVANLLTGGAAASAAGVVGAQNARTGAFGNIIDVAAMAAGVPPGTFTGGSTPPPQTFNNAPVIPGF